MPATLTLHGLVGCPFTQRVVLCSVALSLPIRFKWYTKPAEFKTQEYLAINGTGKVPTLETDQGIIRETNVILRYLSNLDTKQNLAGRTLFERAQVDEWMSYVDSISLDIIRHFLGNVGKFPVTESEREEHLVTVQKSLAGVESHFKSNKYFCGDHLTIADMCLMGLMCGNGRSATLPESVMNKLPNLTKWYNNMASQDWFKRVMGNTFSYKTQHGLPDAEAVEKNIALLMGKTNTGGKKESKKASKQDKKAAKKVDKKPEPKKAEEEEFDLFGDETEEDKVAAEALKKKQEEANKPKKVKAPIIAKSSVVFEIKGYELEADWEAMNLKVRKEIVMDGLTWMDVYRVLPIAFGMKKLQMTMLIVDDKIETQDVFDVIESWEEDVQSTDIVSFSKA